MNASDRALGACAGILPTRTPRATRLALEMLARLDGGTLALELPGSARLTLGRGAPVARLAVHDHRVFDEALARGDIGFAEAWMDGLWDTDDLAGLLTLLSRNRPALTDAIHGRVLRLLGQRLLHLLRANTRRGSRRNIEAHYDLGNDFYELWLDPTMTYSSALFGTPDDTLEQAQRNKYRRILAEVAPRRGDTILEIGCGWGGFAEIAATEFDCRVVGLTLSRAQLGHARARALLGGWADRARFEFCDYRDVQGTFDHVVSIEMIEAVGERFWPVYFGRLAELTRPGGRCVVQAITIDDALFPRYRKGTDFIQRHVFPGGMLPSPGAVASQATRAGLAITGDFAFGRHYADTLALWRRRFEERQEAVRAQGFDERFLRMWRFYLAYCEAGFRTGDLDVHHYRFEHARHRNPR